MAYDLRFGQNLNERAADSIEQAVAGIVGYLEQARKDYLASGISPSGELTELIIFDPLDDDYIPFTPKIACDMLASDDKVKVYLRTHSVGLYDEAGAELHQMSATSPSVDQVLLATEQAEAICRKVLTTDEPEKTGFWQPSDVHEIHVLRAAEVRLFALRLRKIISRLPTDGRFIIDRQCGFIEGTIAKMLHPVDPMKPTTKQIDALARLLKINPGELWVDLAPYYFEQIGGWPMIPSPAELDADMP
jgi:hypothetical protein